MARLRLPLLVAALVACLPAALASAEGAVGGIGAASALALALPPRSSSERAHAALDAASSRALAAKSADARAPLGGSPARLEGEAAPLGEEHAHDAPSAHQVAPHGGHDDHDGCEHDAHAHAHHSGGGSMDDEAATTMILFLILLTIIFEKVKHKLDHNRTPSEKLVINALFGEVTVLGFIALVTFFMIKSGVFQLGSAWLYDDEHHLLHLFEDVHFGLFFTMMLYLLLVMWVLFVQMQTKKRWAELEEQTKRFVREVHAGKRNDKAGLPARHLGKGVKAPSLPMPKDEYLEWRYNGGGRIPVGFDGVMHAEAEMDIEASDGMVTEKPDSAELHAYMLLRARFIWGCTNGEGRKNSQVTDSFDFSRYLDNCLGETLEQIVIVHEYTWMAIAVFMLAAYALFAHAGDVGGCAILALIGVLLAGSLVWLTSRLRLIQAQLSPPIESNVRLVMTGHKAAAAPYVALPVTKGLSKHEQLFPLGAQGPAFLVHFLRTALLMAAIYSVGLVSVFAAIMLEQGAQALMPVCVGAVLVCMGLVRPVLPRLTIVTAVGLLKRPKMIDLTIREVRLESSIKTMKVLATLQSQIRRLKKVSRRKEGAPADKARALDPKQRAELYDAFRLFDEDGSGTIDSKELLNLLRNLGQAVEQAEAERLILEMDTGDDGQVSFEEFCQVMADDDDAPVENASLIAQEMFSMLDTDNSGEITLREFRQFLSGLPIDLTVDEVDQMLNDIFGDDDDSAINAHEFERFLTENETGF